MLHAVLFDKSYFTLQTAKLWLKRHKIIPIKNVHVTQNFYRFRINEPVRWARYYSKYVTDGVIFVFI